MLTDSSLKYYRDSTAEEVRQLGAEAPSPHQQLVDPWKGLGWAQVGSVESRLPRAHARVPSLVFLLQADELDGEIDLRSCTDVTEFAVQRNYGFQIHVRLLAAGGCWGDLGFAPQKRCGC